MEERNIDFKRLETLILNPKFNQGVEEDIVLFVGKSGVGKSTVINYLLGRKFEENDNEETAPVAIPVGLDDLDGENYPYIGQDSTIATTLYAQAYGNHKGGYTLELMCDEKPSEDEVKENILYLYLNNSSSTTNHSGVECVLRSPLDKVRTIRISDTDLGNQLETIKNLLSDTANKRQTLTNQAALKAIFSATSKKGITPKNSFFYCDCPGFCDNRGAEERICATMSTELAVRSAKNVKGIAVVLDWTALVQDKFTSLVEICEILSALVPSFTQISSSIFFLINNKYSSRKAITEKIVAATSRRIREQIISGTTGRERSVEQNAKICAILNMISETEKNIFIFNIFDNGSSKETFIKRLEESESNIPKTNFNFNEYDVARKKFNQIIFYIAAKGREIIAKYINVKERIEANKRMLNNLRDQDSLLKKLSPVLSKTLPAEYPLSLDVKSKLLGFLSQSIKDIGEEMEANSVEREKLKKKNETNLNRMLNDLLIASILFLCFFQKIFYSCGGSKSESESKAFSVNAGVNTCTVIGFSLPS